MKGYPLTIHNLQEFVLELQKELESSKVVMVNTADPKLGRWGMARLWRSWIASVSDVMAGRGVTMPLMINADGSFHGARAFTAEDGHALFSSHYLGSDSNGRRLSWAKSSKDGSTIASKGQRFHALQKLEHFAIEKGIILIKPQDSEFSRLERDGGER